MLSLSRNSFLLFQGANPWASSSNTLAGSIPQSISDGVIEIFGLKGISLDSFLKK
jgi:hypothetical protein